VLALGLVAGDGRAAEADPDWDSLEVRQQAVVETAMAFYLTGKDMQYDSQSLVRGFGTEYSRRFVERPPEDATADQTYYSVCSSFTFEVYWNTIRYRLCGSSDTCFTWNETFDAPELVVWQWERKDPGDYEAALKAAHELLEVVQPGDIVVYVNRKKNNPEEFGGHTGVFVGDLHGFGHDMWLDSGGGKYDFENARDEFEPQGTVIHHDFASGFTQIRSSCFPSKRDYITVLRPLKVCTPDKYPLTEAAKARVRYPRLRYERRVQGGLYGSVVEGGAFFYRINLHNYSTKDYILPVKETLPEGVELVSESVNQDGIVEGRDISWSVLLAAGQRKSLIWKVRATAEAGTIIVADKGNCGGIPSNRLTTEVVKRRVTKEDAWKWAAENVKSIESLPKCRVANWVGGYGNEEPNRHTRVHETRTRDLMPGDVVVVCRDNKKPTEFTLYVRGAQKLFAKTADGTEREVDEREVNGFLAADFFCALRPAAE
jgi:hypothetical protein